MRPVFEAPERGDIVLIALFPAAGRASRDSRLAFVLSPQAYNARIGRALISPIVAEVKGYPFEALLPGGLPVRGAVLADQAMSLDWRAHRAERVCSLPPAAVEEVLGKLRALLT
jgi:mRNA interferase MazF